MRLGLSPLHARLPPLGRLCLDGEVRRAGGWMGFSNAGYAAPRNPRGAIQKKLYDPVCFRWDDSAAVTATALAQYAAEHAEALKKPRLPARIQQFLNEPTKTDPHGDAEEEFPEIIEIVQRRFSEEGDVATVSELVRRSAGIQKTRELATSHAQHAADALGVLPPSSSRDALLRLCFDVLNRSA